MAIDTKFQQNVGQVRYYGNHFAFINLIQQSVWPQSGGGGTWAGTDGWWRNITPNAFFSQIIYVQSNGPYADEYDYLRSGRYYLTWTGGATLAVLGAGVTQNVGASSANRYAIDVAGNDPSFQLTVYNGTAGTVNVTDAKLFHADDEAALIAGEIFQPAFLALFDGTDVLRFMDWLQTNEMGWENDYSSTLNPITASNYHALSDRSYGHEETGPNANTTGMPAAMIGTLARRLQKSVWFNIPVKTNSACKTYLATQFMVGATAAWTGDAYVEGGNENWNYGPGYYGNYVYLRDTKAATVNVVDKFGVASSEVPDKIACAAADVACESWAAFASVLPRSRIKRVLCGQAVAFNTYAAMFAYTDPRSGQQVKNMADEYGVAMYFGTGPAGTATNVDHSYQLAAKAWNFPDQYWLDAMLSNNPNYFGVGALAAYMDANTAGLATYAPGVKLTCYEGGNDMSRPVAPRYPFTINTVGAANTLKVVDTWDAGTQYVSDIRSNPVVYGGVFYTPIANSLNVAPPNAAYWLSLGGLSAQFDTGDWITNFGTRPSSGLPSYFGVVPCPVMKFKNASEIWLFADSTALALDTGNTGAGALTLDAPAGAAIYYLDNVTRLRLLGAHVKELLDGAVGETVFRKLFTGVTHDRSTLHSQFVSCGSYKLIQESSLTRSQFLAKNPRQLFLDTIKFKGRGIPGATPR